jgi:hypothetical protein
MLRGRGERAPAGVVVFYSVRGIDLRGIIALWNRSRTAVR